MILVIELRCPLSGKNSRRLSVCLRVSERLLLSPSAHQLLLWISRAHGGSSDLGYSEEEEEERRDNDTDRRQESQLSIPGDGTGSTSALLRVCLCRR